MNQRVCLLKRLFTIIHRISEEWWTRKYHSWFTARKICSSLRVVCEPQDLLMLFPPQKSLTGPEARALKLLWSQGTSMSKGEMENLHLFFFLHLILMHDLLTKFGEISVPKQSQQSFSEKVQIVDILDFGGQMISLETIQLQQESRPTQYVNKQSWLCSSETLFMDTEI